MIHIFNFVFLLLGVALLLPGTASGNQDDAHQFKNALESRESSHIATLSPEFFTDQGSKRVKLTYGPYTVSPVSVNNGMDSFIEAKVQVGCQDCLITYMQAGLEYPNGTYANANTSLWLHHTVLYNLDKIDTVCNTNVPGERFFASGNERDPINICTNGTNAAGYYVGPNDNIAMLTEMMNSATTEQTAHVTITYEYIPKIPANFSKVTPVWLDVAGCTSETPAKNKTVSQYESAVWTANITGHVTSMVGHLHDGGTLLQVFNNNATVCDCVAAYGQSSGYIDPVGSMGMGMGNSNMSTMGMHISTMTECSGSQINLGDRMAVTAFYNGSEHALMTNNDGSLTPVMGIALIHVAENVTSTTTAPSGASTLGGAAVPVTPSLTLFAGAIIWMITLALVGSV